MVTRLEVIKEIEGLETRKVHFQEVLSDIENYYFIDGKVTFHLNSNNFNEEYEGESIQFNEMLLKEYLKSEIAWLDTKIEEKILSLKSL